MLFLLRFSKMLLVGQSFSILAKTTKNDVVYASVGWSEFIYYLLYYFTILFTVHTHTR